MLRELKRAAACAMSAVLLTAGTLAPVKAASWTAPGQTEWEDLSRDDVKVRFAVGSDLHIGRNDDASEKLKNAFDVFYDADSQLDAAVFVGDITNNGAEGEYNKLIDILNDKLKENTKLGLMMGNHEFNTASGAVNRYKAAVGRLKDSVNQQDTNNNITVGDGYHIITMSAKNYGGDYSDNYDWLKQQLEEAAAEDQNKPIFLAQHHGFKDTAYVTNEWYGQFGKIQELLKEYPQVIDFSGHSHATLNDPRSINQDLGFTAIQDGTIGAYFENESGKMEGTRPDDSENASQALIVEVDADNQVTIRRMDLTAGKYIGKTWNLDVPDLVKNKAYTYTTQKRTEESAVPSFPRGAKMTASNVKDSSVDLTFTQGRNEDKNDDGWVHSYRIKAVNKETGKTDADKLTFSDYYMPPMKAEMTKTLTGLSDDTDYRIEITAINPFQKESTQKLTADIKTPSLLTEEELKKDAPKADLLDINFESGTASDKSEANHTAVTKGSPVIAENELLGKKTAKFDGSSAYAYNFTADEYTKLQKGYTMECMMKLDSKGNPFSDQESAGAGFEMNSDKKTLEFWSRHGSSYKVPKAQVDISKWVHAAAVYDGSNVKLYINGKLKDTVAASDEWVIPADGAKYFFVGADTNKNGEIQNAISGEIASARIYSRALSIGEITKLYWNEANTAISVPGDASFTAIRGTSYTVPEASAQVTATGDSSAKVTAEVKDSSGSPVAVANRKFTATDKAYTITYKANNAEIKKEVKVQEPAAPAADTKKTLEEKQGFRINIKNKAADAKVSYKSSSSSVASVSAYGYVTAKKAGTSVITTTVVQNQRTYTLKTEIKVVKKPSVVSKKTVYAGKGFRMSISNKDKGAKVSFKSSDKSIASVSKFGYVTGKKAGTAYITASVTQNGKVYTLKTKVTVKAYIKVTKAYKTVKKGRKVTFKAKAYGTGKSVKWSVSNKRASISKSGRFKAVKKGKVYVIMKSGKITKKYLVKIK
ncbi:LamG-like jellyroll fold domain-containing protein [Anaerostipes sp.]|uniref:LamG-like jellyroll fold domain-containing protein n=1 Tax=Anaerostipes sp. TaxID=1872530 RepID=UPI0025BA77CA|nr:LamG-like jellyroll fold domain-containing protein [Anaerostipes sp.]MBS7007526.1 Ig-like domain-containing protein [Anaerostipes sp.]